MPLKEPYVSIKVHKAAFRPDPATLPIAGAASNKQDSPREPLQYNRKKYPIPSLELVIPGNAVASNFSSTARCSYVPIGIAAKKARYDFSAAMDSTKLSGLGYGVRGIDDTAEWMSTKVSTFDAGKSGRPTSIVEKKRQLVESNRQLQQWESLSRTSYGKNCRDAVQCGRTQTFKATCTLRLS